MTGASDHSAYCAELVREFDKDRYVAALFAPAHLRPALMTLYAFAVEIARVRSLAREILPGEIRLQWWRDALSGREHGGVAGNPVAAAMLDAIDAHDLPREVFDRFLDAHRMALYGEPPSSMTDSKPNWTIPPASSSRSRGKSSATATPSTTSRARQAAPRGLQDC